MRYSGTRVKKISPFVNTVQTIILDSYRVKLKIRSYKLAQIWFFSLMRANIDLLCQWYIDETCDPGIYGDTTAKKALLQGVHEELVRGNRAPYSMHVTTTSPVVTDVLYHYGMLYFEHYRRMLNLGGPERLRFSERMFMKVFTEWYRCGCAIFMNPEVEVNRPYAEHMPINEKGYMLFSCKDDNDFVTWDYKVELFLWNKLVYEAQPSYRGAGLSDILATLSRNSWEVKYETEAVLTPDDKPRKPIRGEPHFYS